MPALHRMSLPAAVDIELFFNGSLIVLFPRSVKGRNWIQHFLKPTGWQVGPAGAFLADRGEFAALTAWLSRDGLRFEVRNPEHGD